MKDQIQKIRELLDEIESSKPSEEPSFKETSQLFELPELVASIVDYLQPILLPYEAAIYWHMFRHSIIATGDVFVRVSVRGLQEGIVTSMRSRQEGNSMSYGTVQDSLAGLCEKGAISLAGETNREGTPYRVHLPEEIKICQDAMATAQKEQLPKIDPKRELDFYNVKENRLKVFERDKYLCHYCKKQLTRFSATLDHIQPVSKGGDNSYDNLVTACLLHNSQRNNQPIMDFLIRRENSQSS
ncbi:MAG TPA: HNH endonuclease [Verrucomicrobiae bacterium]|nr:HNH endonuclease [Verrucomicrobiae bacterium]